MSIIQLLRCEPQLFDMTKSVYLGVSCEILQLGSAEAKESLKSHKKISPKVVGEILALLFLNFVATKILLRLSEDNVLAQNWVVFAEAELVWSVHSILLCIVKTDTRFF